MSGCKGDDKKSAAEDETDKKEKQEARETELKKIREAERALADEAKSAKTVPWNPSQVERFRMRSWQVRASSSETMADNRAYEVYKGYAKAETEARRWPMPFGRWKRLDVDARDSFLNNWGGAHRSVTLLL